VATRLGWRGGFVVALVAIAAGWAVAAFRLLPAARETLAPRRPAASAGTLPPASRDWAAIGVIYLATFSLAVAWAGGIATFLPLYGGRALGLDAERLGRVLSVAYVVEAVLLVPIGWAADVLGRVRLLVPGLAVMMAGVLLVPQTRGVVTYAVGATLLVLGITVWMVPPVLLAERLPGGFRGPAAGLYRFVSDLGYVAAPAAVGWLIGRGGFALAASTMAGLFAAAAAASLVVLRTSTRRA